MAEIPLLSLMQENSQEYLTGNKTFSSFQQYHIDSTRYAVNDNCPLHDPLTWMFVDSNPSGSPVVMGAQLAGFVENKLLEKRITNPDTVQILHPSYSFSNYHLVFTNVLKKEEKFSVITRPVEDEKDHLSASYQITLFDEKQHSFASGSYCESKRPAFLTDSITRTALYSLRGGRRFYHKRIALDLGHSRNFLLGCLADQAHHFDTKTQRKTFPLTYFTGLALPVLYERQRSHGHDTDKHPLFPTQLSLSIDRNLSLALEHGSTLDFFIEEVRQSAHNKGKGGWQIFHLYAMNTGGHCLYRAEITTATFRTFRFQDKQPDIPTTEEIL